MLNVFCQFNCVSSVAQKISCKNTGETVMYRICERFCSHVLVFVLCCESEGYS